MNITGWDIGLVIAVYLYVVIVFLVAEKFLKHRPSLSRKFVHIMVGNMVFFMPFFTSPSIMVWFITIPATIGVFLLTDYSPIKIPNTVTDSGHALGLFYYTLIWTILLIIFGVYSNNLWVVALGIGALVYGDGFASLIGAKFGRIKYTISGGEKTVAGSLAMFVVVGVMSIFIWAFYQFVVGYPGMPELQTKFGLILLISAISTIIEAITPGGFDNISVAGGTAIMFYALTFL